jgi:hypothetical protein
MVLKLVFSDKRQDVNLQRQRKWEQARETKLTSRKEYSRKYLQLGLGKVINKGSIS